MEQTAAKRLGVSLAAGVYTLAGYMVGLAVAGVCLAALQISSLALMIVFTWAGPFLVGWLVFRPLIVGYHQRGGYLATLKQTALVELIGVNLMLGTTAPLFDLLRFLWLGVFLDPRGATLWLVVAISAAAGAAAIAGFYGWLCNRGYRLLVMRVSEGQVGRQEASHTATVRRLWAPLAVSLLLLVVGTYLTIRIE